MHRDSKLRQDRLAVEDQPSCGRNVAPHRLDRSEMVEDEGLGATVAAELRPDALAALDRGVHMHRPRVCGGRQPTQRIRPSALVSGAAEMLDRVLPGGVGIRGLRLYPVDEAA